ncbi:MAG: ABC transporter substrate-binding protein [Acidimicrobiales bacterium]|nr:ABC transporter substrate-binding protein [Acidimicrobiales bacterium]MDG1845985.1 ABC transporter substrate-binding protein [Acidimicrobiales bacterium]
MAATVRSKYLVLLTISLLIAGSCSDPIVPTVAPPPTVTPNVPTPTPVPVTTTTITPEKTPEKTEPGLTSDTMRIAVIADGANAAINDGEAESIWQAVEAWANSINKTTKLAGRTVIVDRVDSAVSRHSEAIEKVCNGDYFAIVGSASLNDSEGIQRLMSPDCALPDFPSSIYSAKRLNSEVTFLSNPIFAPTINTGWGAYFSQKNPEAVERAATLFPELSSLVVGGNQIIEAATAMGYRFIHSPIYGIETDFQGEADALIQSGSLSLTWRNSGTQLLGLLEVVAEIDPDYSFEFIDCGQSCYNRDWVAKAGDLGEGISVWLPHLPIEEAELDDELLRYLFYLISTHGTDGTPSAAGVGAWSAALLFQEAVSRAVGIDSAAYKPEALSMQAVIDAAKTINFWDANGLHGIANPSQGIPSPCFMVMTLSDGVWKRTYPERPGELDCEESNLITLEALRGLTPIEPDNKNPE